MRQKSGPEKQPVEDTVKDIRRATRRHFSAEEMIRIVLEGLPSAPPEDDGVAHACPCGKKALIVWISANALSGLTDAEGRPTLSNPSAQ